MLEHGPLHGIGEGVALAADRMERGLLQADGEALDMLPEPLRVGHGELGGLGWRRGAHIGRIIGQCEIRLMTDSRNNRDS